MRMKGCRGSTQRTCITCDNSIDKRYLYSIMRENGFSKEDFQKIWYDETFQFRCCDCFVKKYHLEDYQITFRNVRT